jgi:hypothetical protein
MNQQAFFDCVFELVDVWTSTAEEREYVLFLCNLISETCYCKEKNNGPSKDKFICNMIWRPVREVCVTATHVKPSSKKKGVKPYEIIKSQELFNHFWLPYQNSESFEKLSENSEGQVKMKRTTSKKVDSGDSRRRVVFAGYLQSTGETQDKTSPDTFSVRGQSFVGQPDNSHAAIQRRSMRKRTSIFHAGIYDIRRSVKRDHFKTDESFNESQKPFATGETDVESNILQIGLPKNSVHRNQSPLPTPGRPTSRSITPASKYPNSVTMGELLHQTNRKQIDNDFDMRNRAWSGSGGTPVSSDILQIGSFGVQSGLLKVLVNQNQSPTSSTASSKCPNINTGVEWLHQMNNRKQAESNASFHAIPAKNMTPSSVHGGKYGIKWSNPVSAPVPATIKTSDLLSTSPYFSSSPKSPARSHFEHQSINVLKVHLPVSESSPHRYDINNSSYSSHVKDSSAESWLAKNNLVKDSSAESWIAKKDQLESIITSIQLSQKSAVSEFLNSPESDDTKSKVYTVDLQVPKTISVRLRVKSCDMVKFSDAMQVQASTMQSRPQTCNSHDKLSGSRPDKEEMQASPMQLRPQTCHSHDKLSASRTVKEGMTLHANRVLKNKVGLNFQVPSTKDCRFQVQKKEKRNPNPAGFFKKKGRSQHPLCLSLREPGPARP